MFKQLKNENACVYTGDTAKTIDISSLEKYKFILATFSIFEEGVDLPYLNTLVLASPKANIHQACGRIFRCTNDTVSTDQFKTIIDFVDDCDIGYALLYKRKRFYQQQEFKIIGDKKEEDIVVVEKINTKNIMF